MAESTFKDAMDAIATAIGTLSLDGIGTGEIKVRRLPHDGEVWFPGITVHPVEEKYDDGTNNRDDVGYGCAVTMVKNNDNASNENIDRILTWRMTIRQKFLEDDALGGLGTVYRVMVEHGEVFDPRELVASNYDVSTMIIRVWCRESRT